MLQVNKFSSVLDNELKHFFYATSDFCCIANSKGFFEIFNPRFEEVLGYSANELLQNPFLHFVHPDDVQTTLQEMEKLNVGITSTNFTNRYRKRDGEYIWLEWTAKPDISTGKIYAIARNVTTRKTEEDFFRLLVESSPYAIVTINQSGEIIQVNAETERLFGYKKTELEGQSLEILMPAAIRNSHVHHRTEFFLKPETRGMGKGRDLFAQRKTGEEFPVEIGLNPFNLSGAKFTIASIIDISNRKAQEMAINRRQHELESKNKELEQFAYIASHDLQEPLRTVTNYIQLLKKNSLFGGGNVGLTYLNASEDAISRMRTLIKQLLAYSRLGRSKKLSKVDTNLLLDNVISDLNGIIKSSKARIAFKNLPTIMAYELELKQLFQNLISNSIKFQKKGVAPQVIITSKETKKEWLFSVTDNGIGIDSKSKDKIFLIFQRLHSAEEYEGSGIGLANCKKIVELHKGRIWVESEPEKGSVFNFTIPKYIIYDSQVEESNASR